MSKQPVELVIHKCEWWREHFASKCFELGILPIETCPNEDHTWKDGLCIYCDKSELEHWFWGIRQTKEWKETEKLNNSFEEYLHGRT